MIEDIDYDEELQDGSFNYPFHLDSDEDDWLYPKTPSPRRPTREAPVINEAFVEDEDFEIISISPSKKGRTRTGVSGPRTTTEKEEDSGVQFLGENVFHGKHPLAETFASPSRTPVRSIADLKKDQAQLESRLCTLRSSACDLTDADAFEKFKQKEHVLKSALDHVLQELAALTGSEEDSELSDQEILVNYAFTLDYFDEEDSDETLTLLVKEWLEENGVLGDNQEMRVDFSGGATELAQEDHSLPSSEDVYGWCQTVLQSDAVDKKLVVAMEQYIAEAITSYRRNVRIELVYLRYPAEGEIPEKADADLEAKLQQNSRKGERNLSRYMSYLHALE